MTTQQATTAANTSVRRRGALAVAVATAAAAVPWVVAELAGAELEVTSFGITMDVGLPLVLAAALVMSLAGWALLALLQRRVTDGRRTWTVVTLTVLVLSLGGPLTADATSETRVYLLLMHLAVGAPLIPGLRAATRP